jgi:hypothetical protein
MWDFVAATLKGTAVGGEGSRYDLLRLPLHEFGLWIILCFLALHAVVAAIITELMTRSYGKWWMWLVVSLGLPVVGPISILLYHLIAATGLSEARKQTFWERMLLSGPVSLYRAFRIEQARWQDVKLRAFGPRRGDTQVDREDPHMEDLIRAGKFGEARAYAWEMMEIARERLDADRSEQYQQYLEVIAERQSQGEGRDLPSPSGR